MAVRDRNMFVWQAYVIASSIVSLILLVGMFFLWRAWSDSSASLDAEKQKNVTQEDVYNDTGIHVARIEQGKRDISFTTLCKLAEYFGVNINSFQ